MAHTSAKNGALAVEVTVSPWVQQFCEGMQREVAAWERAYPAQPINGPFVLRAVSQFVTRFGIKVAAC